MSDILTTARLTLRRFRKADATAVTAAMQDRDIVRMLPRLPWPYSRTDAEHFIGEIAAREPTTFAIEHDGMLIGSVSTHAQLGYWLVQDAWGQGFATEASTAVLDLRFSGSADHVMSGHRLGNHRSRNVLTKLGFQDTNTRDVFNNAEQKTVTLQDMILTQNDWETRQ